MVISWKNGKTIHSEARELINHVNHQCKQDAVEKSLILPICRADEVVVVVYLTTLFQHLRLYSVDF
jgi:hypothetical protein